MTARTIADDGINEEPGYPFCPDCGQDMDWIDCDLCGGEGFFDDETLMEQDPLWYQPGDTERCEQCAGKGGWWWCGNRECRSKKDEDDE